MSARILQFLETGVFKLSLIRILQSFSSLQCFDG